jgi:hypothetical protein
MKEIHHLARVKIPHFRDRLERLVSRVARPVMSGEIALEVGCSLAHVVREMDDLVKAGAYRQVEPEELRKHGIEPRVLAYMRV